MKRRWPASLLREARSQTMHPPQPIHSGVTATSS